MFMPFDSRLLSGLPVLSAVLEAGGFAKAGQALGLTQSGVSRAIQRMEERLGCRLFERTSKSMRLTEEGTRFCQEALPLLAHLEAAAEDAANATGVARGRLRVNIDPSFARVFLASRVGAFLEAHPELQLELSVRDQIGDLIAEGFDAALRFGEPEPSSLIARRLLQVHILTCAAPAYLARRGRPAMPRNLGAEGHECLLFRDPTTGRPFPWEFHQGKRKRSVEVSGRLVVNDAQMHLEACIAGHGIAQVMDFTAAPFLESGQLVELFPGWADELFPLYLYHPSRHFVPAKLKVLTEFLVSALESLKG